MTGRPRLPYMYDSQIPADQEELYYQDPAREPALKAYQLEGLSQEEALTRIEMELEAKNVGNVEELERQREMIESMDADEWNQGVRQRQTVESDLSQELQAIMSACDTQEVAVAHTQARIEAMRESATDMWEIGAADEGRDSQGVGDKIQAYEEALEELESMSPEEYLSHKEDLDRDLDQDVGFSL